MVKMLNSSNKFVLIGSPNNTNLNKRQAIVWDNLEENEIYRFTIENEILNLEITSDRIIIVCENQILEYNPNNFELIDTLNTRPNPKGLISVSYINRKFLVYPGEDLENEKLIIKDYDIHNSINFNPGKEEISNFTLSYNGLFLAIVIKNDKIKIYETNTRRYLEEFSVIDKEEGDNIKFISFNNGNNFISASSTKGSIFIYSLKKSKELIGAIDEMDRTLNIHGFSLLSDQQLAFNHVNLKKYNDSNYEVVKLGDQNILYIITSNFRYFKIEFKYTEKIKNKDGDFQISWNFRFIKK